MESDGRCVGSVASFEQQKRPARPRVAVGLRGESFRNWGSRTTQGTCCHTATIAAQAAVAASHERLLFAPLERMGFEVDVFIATYRCTNGRDWVEKRLLSPLQEPGSVEKIFEIDSHIGVAMSGLSADARTLPFTAKDFVLKFSLPNFFFHVTTAYGLLRHKGTPIGKLDFLAGAAQV